MEMSPEDEMGGPPMMGTPRDLYELYMMARAELYSVVNFNTLYFKMLFLIDLGKEMLPAEYDGLRRAAEKLLSDTGTYPQPSQMEFTGQTYRISTGASTTGLIEVRVEDVNAGRDEIRDQKAASLLPRIKEMDSRIFKGLIESGILEIKRPLMEEVLMQDVMASIQERMSREPGPVFEEELTAEEAVDEMVDGEPKKWIEKPSDDSEEEEEEK